MTTKSFLWSSMPLTNASIASNPKGSPASRQSEYASSINKTPPRALLITLFVFCAVSPRYCPTRSALVTSFKCPEERTPIDFRNWATILAIVVLPVPGFPVNIICMEISALGRPLATRIFWIFTFVSKSKIKSLTFLRPIILSSSFLMTSNSFLFESWT